MLILDKSKILNLLKSKGFASISELAKKMGLHRNSISAYLSGKEIIFPVVKQLLVELDAKPEDVIIRKPIAKNEQQAKKDSLKVVHKLNQLYPQYSYYLFGSRTSSSSRKYSDIDIGILAHQPIALQVLSDMRKITDLVAEDFPWKVDLVDLKRADAAFLKEALKNAEFIGGSPAIPELII